MDPRLLNLYEQELRYFRESSGEFARAFPKIARRLGLEGQEVADPYVERLIEATAFLSARVGLKLDAEYPRFTGHLLDIAASIGSVTPDAEVPPLQLRRLRIEGDELDQLVDALNAMRERLRQRALELGNALARMAAILSGMNSDAAYSISVLIAGRNANAPKN